MARIHSGISQARELFEQLENAWNGESTSCKDNGIEAISLNHRIQFIKTIRNLAIGLIIPIMAEELNLTGGKKHPAVRI